MKKKILSILLAVTLILSFGLMATPVMAGQGGDVELTVLVEPEPIQLYNLDITIVGGGKVTYTDPDTGYIVTFSGEGTHTISYEEGTYSDEFTAKVKPADAPWKFDSWAGGPTDSGDPTILLPILMDGHRAVTATFLPKIVSIHIDKTTVDFGTVVAGTLSDTKTVTVTNNGDYIVDVTTEVTDGGAAAFYVPYLNVDPSTISDLAMGGSTPVNLQLNVPGSFVPSDSPYTGTIVFWAEPQ